MINHGVPHVILSFLDSLITLTPPNTGVTYDKEIHPRWENDGVFIITPRDTSGTPIASIYIGDTLIDGSLGFVTDFYGDTILTSFTTPEELIPLMK
jgi:hypothetical protein